MNLTIGFITARHKPEQGWFLDSLLPQIKDDDRIEVIVCDLHYQGTDRFQHGKIEMVHTEPKPNPFGGRHRLTKDHWWAKPSQINTVVCMAKYDFLGFTDDRSVVSSHWLDSIKEAHINSYIVAGAYEKRHNMKVEHGVIVDRGTEDGTDRRSPFGKDHREVAASYIPKPCSGNWLFGCTYALPLEAMLTVNGSDERLDGTSFEDCILGCNLKNYGYHLAYDPRMKVTQDRTPSECGPAIRRSSKEKHPHDTTDKCHHALREFASKKKAEHGYDLRQMRHNIQLGGQWTPVNPEAKDWFDGMPIKEFDNLP